MVLWMAYGALLAAVFGCAAWLIERAALRQRWPLRHAWQLAMLASSLVPLLAASSSGVSAPSSPPWSDAVPQLAVPPSAMAPAPDMTHPAGSNRLEAPLPTLPRLAALTSSPRLNAALLYVWITASSLLLLWLGASLWHLSRTIRGLRRLRIGDDEVRISDRMGPAVFGAFRPLIVLPRWLLEAPQELRAMVLAHERSHIAARDPLCYLASLVLVLLLPWNLPLWWQLRRLRFAMEVDCDQRVLREVPDVCAYGEMLLSVGERGLAAPLGAVALTEPVSQLERRIRIMTDDRTRHAALLLSFCSACCLSLLAAAAQVEAPPLPQQQTTPKSAPAPLTPPPAAPPQNRLVFGAVAEPDSDAQPVTADTQQRTALQPLSPDSPRTQRLLARLQDPEQRAVLRAEQRAALERSYRSLAEALSLDAPATGQLLDLLTEQRLQEMEQNPMLGSLGLFASSAPRRRVMSFPGSAQKDAARLAASHLDQLRDLLGSEGLERLQYYQDTLSERGRVAIFEAQLPPADALTRDQREQLVTLLQSSGAGGNGYFTAFAAPTVIEPGTDMRKLSAENLTRTFNAMSAATRATLAAAVGVLTPRQFAVYERLETSALEQMRPGLEQARAAAGLDPDLDSARPDAAAKPGRAVQLRIVLRVNRGTPTSFNVDTTDGKAVSFKINETLIGEVTPSFSTATLMPGFVTPGSEALLIAVKLYERTGTGRREVGQQPVLTTLLANKNDAQKPKTGSGDLDTAVATTSGYYDIAGTITVRVP